eukprot:5154752-Pleurochrysis_carterae.AAC.1
MAVIETWVTMPWAAESSVCAGGGEHLSSGNLQHERAARKTQVRTRHTEAEVSSGGGDAMVATLRFAASAAGRSEANANWRPAKGARGSKEMA